MVFGLDRDRIFAHRQTDQELALRVGRDPNGGAHGLSGSAGFHLSTLQNLAVLVQDAAQNHNASWHDQIAEVAGLARRKQEWPASQRQFVRG